MPFYLDVQKERTASFSVVYKRLVGAYGPENHQWMERMKRWVQENGLACEQTMILGIAWDDPSVTAAEMCRYDICVTSQKNICMDSDYLERETIDGGCYAVFLIEHTAEAVRTAWSQCFAALPELGFVLDRTRPVMERYQTELVDRHCCELCVPIMDTEPASIEREAVLEEKRLNI